jgi:hypothetical protein
MKKLFTFLAVAILAPIVAISQHTVEITPFAGYVFGSYWYGSGGNFHVDGSAQYGGQISFGISRVVDIDLIYNRADTKAQINYNDYSISESAISVNYMMVGFTKNFRVSPLVSPFLGMNFGAVEFYPKDGQYNDAWFFAMGALGGAKIYFSKHVGLKLQAQLYFPVQGAGYTIYLGPYGPSSGMGLYSSMVQFGFTGGLVFRLGHVM